jgi:hypothetical protein
MNTARRLYLIRPSADVDLDATTRQGPPLGAIRQVGPPGAVDTGIETIMRLIRGPGNRLEEKRSRSIQEWLVVLGVLGTIRTACGNGLP